MGWPKGKSRKPVKAETVTETALPPEPPETSRKKWTAMVTSPADEARRAWVKSAKAKWEPDEWRDRSSDDMLAVSDEVRGWAADSGFDLQWCTQSVFGQEQTRHWTQLQMNGWEPLCEEMFPGQDVFVGGVVLCARPMTISRKARKLEAEKARAPIVGREQMLGISGVPGVTGGNHPSALRHNRISRTIEKIEIPGD